MVRVGDKIVITSDNENYDRWRNKVWRVNHIVPYNNPAYDNGLYPQKLVEAKGLPVALYEFEFRVVKKK